MPWTCPECSDTNKNELIECTCGYEILPQDNVKLENELNEELVVFIALFPVIYIAITFLFIVIGISFGFLLAFISPLVFLLSSLVSLVLWANTKGKKYKTPIIGLLLNLVFLIFSAWSIMRGGSIY